MAAPAAANRYKARELLAEAELLLERGERNTALVNLEQAIDLDVDLLVAYRHAIPIWIESDRLAVLRGRLERVTARHPEFAMAWYALGYAYRRGGRADLAVLAYRTYVSLRPREPAAYFGLAMAYKLDGQQQRAEKAFLRYLRRETDTSRADYVARARGELFALAVRRIVGAYIAPYRSASGRDVDPQRSVIR